MTSDVSDSQVEFTDLPEEEEVSFTGRRDFASIVVHPTDWTAETIVAQLERGNILLTPRFQRRDAWSLPRKSRFIESIILGLPIPQVVLAADRANRGQFIVLDGKQRLLTLLQYWGKADPESKHNSFALSSLEARPDLSRLRYSDIDGNPLHKSDYNALSNNTIRTVVIRNWPSVDFLHMVFLRLNTGTLPLSPQELRQAMFPGPFSDFVDDASCKSEALHGLLGRSTPDPRMRDVELLSRFIAFQVYLPSYSGRMKNFLDFTFEQMNEQWSHSGNDLSGLVALFEESVRTLTSVFGVSEVARKPGSASFNKAIFDFLILYCRFPEVRAGMLKSPQSIIDAYRELFKTDTEFARTIERDTAGLPSTYVRLRRWGETLRKVLGVEIPLPKLEEAGGKKRISLVLPA